jgi:2'-5' RNA ligase
VRLFFAVELPEDARAALGRLKPADESRDYRWSDPSLLHITLAFLGEQPEARLEALERLGRRVASSSERGSLRLGQAGQFGSKRTPRVLWVDVSGDVERLHNLQRRLDQALRVEGFPVEERPFKAHITLARRRETARGGAPTGWPSPPRPITFALDQLTLMQSRLSPRGPTYTPVFQFPLGGG